VLPRQEQSKAQAVQERSGVRAQSTSDSQHKNSLAGPTTNSEQDHQDLPEILTDLQQEQGSLTRSTLEQQHEQITIKITNKTYDKNNNVNAQGSESVA
jgi:transcriptional regulator of heat shock response